MRRFQIITLAALAAFLIPAIAMGAVSSTFHDMTTYTGTGTGVAARVCQACHTPHNAGTDKLWAQTVTIVGGFSNVQNLCYTCHDGTITGVGSATAFSTTLESHTTTGSDCSGGADSCHDVHDNTNGKFLTVVPDGNGVYCTSCHGATPSGAYPGGNHLAGSQHYTAGSTFTCNDCHTPHGAVLQSGVYNFGDVTSGKPILRDDNFASGEYGTMCINCHTGSAPFNSPVLVTDVYDYRETTFDGTESQHPTFTTSPTGNWTTAMTGCVECHDVHDSGGTPTGTGAGSFLLATDNALSAACVGCHDGASAPGVVGGGGGTHFTGDVSATAFGVGNNPADLPWADELDDDGNAAIPDYVGNTADYMICQTCHSVHKAGFTGAGQAFFLRRANSAANEICIACHTAN